MRVRYAKRDRMRFASHRDIARALERALRRAELPVAFSAGFTPHPRISYNGAAPTGVASEAEYFDLSLTEYRDPQYVRVLLDSALPEGVDAVEAAQAGAENLADRLQASVWTVEMPGVTLEGATEAVAAFRAADTVEVERLTKKGRRRFDTRAAVVHLEVDRRATTDQQKTCAILRMVVRHTTPAVRPNDVVTGLRHVAGLAPLSSPRMTRLAQGPLDDASAVVTDPFAAENAAAQGTGREEAAPGRDTAEVDTAGDPHRPAQLARSSHHE
nr:TIGR03936 family radical SAM-associated protein [Haloactinospora alba]